MNRALAVDLGLIADNGTCPACGHRYVHHARRSGCMVILRGTAKRGHDPACGCEHLTYHVTDREGAVFLRGRTFTRLESPTPTDP